MSDAGLVVVTGAPGFIGSAVVRELVASGAAVRETGLATVTPDAGVEFVASDVLDHDSLAAAMAGATTVVHAAGLAHVFGRKQAAAAPFDAVNRLGTANAARAAAAAGARHFVLISSVSVYGGTAQGTLDESHECHPKGAYAQSKLLAEQEATRVAEASGMDLTVLRLATAYGEGDRGNVIRLIRAVDRGRFLWVGRGSNRKSLVHRDDVARAVAAVVRRPWPGRAIYNVSAPVCTMREVVDAIARALGRRLPPFYVPAGAARLAGLALARTPWTVGIAGSLSKWLADDAYDASAFARDYGFSTQISLDEGITREVQWYRGR